MIEKHLLSAFNSICQNPTAVEYRRICHMLGHLYNERYQVDSQIKLSNTQWSDVNSDLMKAAFFFSEGQSVTFRHNAMLNINRKLR